MKYFSLLICTALLTACVGFDEPNWLEEARAQEKQKRPLCMRLAGALNGIDKHAKSLDDQQQFNEYVASKRSQVASAQADCKARRKTFSD